MEEPQPIAQPLMAPDQGEDLASAPRRPFLITLFCVLTFIGGPISIIDDWRDPDFLTWQRIYLTLHTGTELFLCFQVWKMRRWAVFGFLVLVAIFQLVLLAAGFWQPLALIIPAPALLVLLLYSRRMR